MTGITFIDPTENAKVVELEAPKKGKVADSSIKFMEPDPSARVKTPREKLREQAMQDALLNPWVASALRGASFGLSDRALAAGQSMFGDKNYEDYLANQFAQRDAFNEEHPYASVATELAGGLVTGGPVVGLVKGAAKAAMPRIASAIAAQGVAPALARGGLTLGGGATAGAVSGAGQAEMGKTLEGAEGGALTGAGAAGALKTVGMAAKGVKRAVDPLVRKAATAIGAADPEKWAQREWMSAVGLDGEDLASLAQRLKELEATGQRGAMAMDAAGINAKSKLKAATIPATNAKAQLEEALNKRSLERGDRLTDALRQSVSGRFDTGNVAEEIYNAARQKADPLYEQARRLGTINDPTVGDWFNSTANRKAVLRDYAKAMQDNGTPMTMKMDVDDKGNFIWNRAPTMEDLLNIKDHYGQLRKRLVDPATGHVDNKATVKINGNEYGYDVVNGEYNDLRNLVRGLTPDGNGGSILANADKITGDAFEVNKALNLGKKIRTLSSEDLKRTFSGLESDAEKEAFRMGAAGSLFTNLEKGKAGESAVHQLYGSKAMQEKMNTIFPDNTAQDYFQKMFGAEKKLAETERQMMPRVSAAGGTAADEAVDTTPLSIAGNLATGRIGAASTGIARFFNNQYETHMPQYAEPLLKMGMLDAAGTEALAQRMAQPPGALSRVGSALGRGASTTAEGAPYAAAGVMGGLTGNPTFDAWLAEQQ